MNVKKIAVVGFLVTRGKSSKDYHVIAWNLEKSATLEADPIGVLLDLEVECLPVNPLLQVKFLDKVGTLPSIESSYNVEVLVFKCKCCVEVSSGVQVRDLAPLVRRDIVDLALVHTLRWQTASDRENLTLLLLNEDACQSVGSPLEKHVSPLNQAFFHELVAAFCGFARFTATSEENPPLLILDWHEVGRDLDIHNVWAIAVRPKIVHEQVVRVVNEKMQSV